MGCGAEAPPYLDGVNGLSCMCVYGLVKWQRVAVYIKKPPVAAIHGALTTTHPAKASGRPTHLRLHHSQRPVLGQR